jgi:hypothetical protein
MSASPRRVLVRGIVAGAAGTAAHSAVLWASQQVARFRQPPQAIVDSVAPIDDREQRRALAMLSHIGFGLGNGVLLVLLHRTLGRPRTLPFALAYGLSLYTVSYAGVVPSLDILPPPHRDSAPRQLALIAAHVGYGAAAAQALSRLSGRRTGETG